MKTEKIAPKTQLRKRIVTTRKNGSKRISYDFSDVDCITDQHSAVEMSMASIVQKLEKGIQPRLIDGPLYTTDLGIRNLQDVMQRQQQTTDLFLQLPTEIRALMGNNIQNFEEVIFDPKNTDLLKKHSLIVETHDKHKELIHAINSINLNPVQIHDETLSIPSKKPSK